MPGVVVKINPKATNGVFIRSVGVEISKKVVEPFRDRYGIGKVVDEIRSGLIFYDGVVVKISFDEGKENS